MSAVAAEKKADAPAAQPQVEQLNPELENFVVPDNYVQRTVENMKWLPPVTWRNLLQNIQWISFLALTIPPALAIYGLFTTPWQTKTAIWA